MHPHPNIPIYGGPSRIQKYAGDRNLEMQHTEVRKRGDESCELTKWEVSTNERRRRVCPQEWHPDWWLLPWCVCGSDLGPQLLHLDCDPGFLQFRNYDHHFWERKENVAVRINLSGAMYKSISIKISSGIRQYQANSGRATSLNDDWVSCARIFL